MERSSKDTGLEGLSLLMYLIFKVHSRVSVAHPKFEISTVRKANDDDKVGQPVSHCLAMYTQQSWFRM